MPNFAAPHKGFRPLKPNTLPIFAKSAQHSWRATRKRIFSKRNDSP